MEDIICTTVIVIVFAALYGLCWCAGEFAKPLPNSYTDEEFEELFAADCWNQNYNGDSAGANQDRIASLIDGCYPPGV